MIILYITQNNKIIFEPLLANFYGELLYVLICLSKIHYTIFYKISDRLTYNICVSTFSKFGAVVIIGFTNQNNSGIRKRQLNAFRPTN